MLNQLYSDQYLRICYDDLREYFYRIYVLLLNNIVLFIKRLNATDRYL